MLTAAYTYLIKDRYSAPLAKIARGTKKFATVAGKAARSANKMSKSLDRVGKKSIAAGRAMSMRLTVPILAVGTAATISFARLEKGLIDVNNLLSRPELKRFGKDLEVLQENAVKAGFSIDDTNKGLFDTVSALGAGKRGFETFKTAQILAIGGNADLGVAVSGLTTLMSVYEEENVTATQAANALFSAQVKGKTTVSELSAGMGNVASTAKMAGIGMNEMLASLSAMTLGGINTDSAVTSLNAVILAIAKPQKDAMKLMDKMGISYGVANIKAKGLQAIFKEIAVAQSKFSEDKVMRAIPERRALKAIAALVSGGKLGKIAEIIAKINSDLKTGDGLMRAFADQNSSMTWTYKRAMGQITVAFKSFIVLIAPAINKMLNFVAKLAAKFQKLSPTTKKIVVAFLAIAAILPPIIIGFGIIAVSVGALIPVISGLWVAMQLMLGVASLFLIPLGLTITGVGLAVIAFVALGAALYQVWKHWDQLTNLKDLPEHLWNYIKQRDPSDIYKHTQTEAENAALEKSQERIAAKAAAGKLIIDGQISLSAGGGASVESASMTANAGNNIPMVQG